MDESSADAPFAGPESHEHVLEMYKKAKSQIALSTSLSPEDPLGAMIRLQVTRRLHESNDHVGIWP